MSSFYTLNCCTGKYDYHKTLNGCSISEDEHGHTAKTSLFIVAFVIPCVIIIYCYARIFSVVRNSELRMKEHSQKTVPSLSSPNAPATKESKRKRNEWRITKMVLAIFLSFVVCYLPITIVKVVDKRVDNIHLHLISYIMLYLSACINPIIYVIMNKQYRKAYGHVIVCKPASVFQTSSAKPKEELPSKTLMSQVSVSMIPMNAIDHQKVNYGS
ncbi:hypothetical protein V9T40_009033 [Parthenolecanium corni]|uniref:G-protein coupled receptors family 1 profile domain-containing protein n=1 Tax=Parthenolecanium corni TaxID=536013 RepID=A0AAN9Y8E5_9HEMI